MCDTLYKLKEITPILDYLGQADLPRGAIAKIHQDTAIPESTLRDWHNKRTQPGMAEWFALCDGHPSARVFDDDTKSSLIDCLKADYIEPVIGGTRQVLASLCLNSYSSTPPDEFRRNRLCVSSRFLRASNAGTI
jgi:hypothetical protein